MTERVLEIMVGGVIPLDVGSVSKVGLVELLGAGAFGTVWKCVDPDTGRLYTLKIIKGIKPGSVMEDRVRMEATVTIPSKYVVPVIGLRQWDPSTFLILFEYYEAKSLEKLLEEGTLNDEQKKSIFWQTLLGVSAAHSCNVIHRDLKPDNILVNGDYQVALIDFGVSKFKGKGVTMTGEVLGTPAYMAPEILIHGARDSDAKVDIFSLGQLLYELAMGQHFWIRNGWRELKDLVEFLKGPPPPAEITNVSDFYCGFYSDAAKVVVRATKIAPEDRYNSVDEMLLDLGHIPYMPETPKGFHLDYPLLIVESGDNRGARTLVNIDGGKSLELGRFDIAGGDGSISRKHLEITREEDRYMVRDLHSLNGTMLRGAILNPDEHPETINHGDRIKVGDVFLRFAFFTE